jgi:type I restriction enzyme M protein
VKLPTPIKKAIFAALGKRDPKAERCIDRVWEDGKGEADRMAGRFADEADADRVIRYEADSELRDTENVPLPPKTALPLPLGFGPDQPNNDLLKAMRSTIDAYVEAEVLPHVADAWIDYAKTKVGYEIPINRHFYVYKPPRPLIEIETDIAKLEGEIADLLKGLVA